MNDSTQPTTDAARTDGAAEQALSLELRGLLPPPADELLPASRGALHREARQVFRRGIARRSRLHRLLPVTTVACMIGALIIATHMFARGPAPAGDDPFPKAAPGVAADGGNAHPLENISVAGAGDRSTSPHTRAPGSAVRSSPEVFVASVWPAPVPGQSVPLLDIDERLKRLRDHVALDPLDAW